jgi:hypothetical protein
MRCSRYRPISEGATGRPPIYPTGSNPKGFNQRDLPYGHRIRVLCRSNTRARIIHVKWPLQATAT